MTIELPEGKSTYRPFALALFDRPDACGTTTLVDAEATQAAVEPARRDLVTLTLFWLEGYGGGLFLPFKDQTSGRETYGGGRYLYDTVKGADLGAAPDSILLDFNFAYNPSCAYNPRWVCPLAPRENVLDFRIEAGEMMTRW